MFSLILTTFLTLMNVGNPVALHIAPDPPLPLARGLLDLLPWGNFSLLDTMANYYVPLPERIDNPECARDVTQMLLQKNLTEEGRWLAQMVDAWGKVPDGFFFGNVHAIGMYEECLGVRASYKVMPQNLDQREGKIIKMDKMEEDGKEGQEERSFRGEYCIVAYLARESNETRTLKDVNGDVKIGIPIAVLVDPAPFYYTTCIPSSCSKHDMEVSVNVTLAGIGRDIMYVACHTDDEKQPLYNTDYIIISVLCVLFILVLLGTILDLTTSYAILPQTYRLGHWRYLLIFSIHHNLCIVFDPQPPKTEATITCLAGMRVLTMVWIIICHQYQTGISFSANTKDFITYQDPVLGQVFTNGWFSADTFFFISGLVLARSFLIASLTSSQTRATFNTYLKALLRLSPMIALVAGFSATLLRLLAHGPLQDQLIQWSQKTCGRLWWKDPLFISNFIIGENTGINVDNCLSQCWFTAVYMQLLLILPLLLIPFTRNLQKGVILLCIVTSGSIIIPLIITIVYNQPPAQLASLDKGDVLEYQWRVSMAPWCRAGPWLIGIWLALTLHYCKKLNVTKSTRFRMNRVLVVSGYLICITVMGILLCGIYPYNHVPPSRSYTKTEAALYGSLARPVWAICVAWIVFTCHTGNAGAVNRILSYEAWWPLSRLSFGVFLVGPVVQRWWASVQYVPAYFNYLDKLLECLGSLFLSGLLSIVLICLIQFPIGSIITLTLQKHTKTTSQFSPL